MITQDSDMNDFQSYQNILLQDYPQVAAGTAGIYADHEKVTPQHSTIYEESGNFNMDSNTFETLR